MNGSVLLFDNQKGWGFIRGSDNKDYFVHYSNIETDRKGIYQKKILCLLRWELELMAKNRHFMYSQFLHTRW